MPVCDVPVLVNTWGSNSCSECFLAHAVMFSHFQCGTLLVRWLKQMDRRIVVDARLRSTRSGKSKRHASMNRIEDSRIWSFQAQMLESPLNTRAHMNVAVHRSLAAMLTDGTGKVPKHVTAKAVLKSEASNVS